MGSLTSHKNQIGESAVRRDLRFFLYLSEKTRKSDRLQMSLLTKAALSSQLFKNHSECWSGRGLNPRPPVPQTGVAHHQNSSIMFKIVLEK